MVRQDVAGPKAASATRSRFIERLREVSRGPVGRIGFGTTAAKQPPALIFAVRLPRNDAKLAQAVIHGGVDAVIANVLGPGPGETSFGTLADERGAIEEIVKAADRVAVGVAIGPNDGVSASDLTALVELGVDFVSIHPHRAPVELLQIEQLGRVMRLDEHYQSGPLRGLNDLAIHAFEVVVSRPENSIGAISLHDLAAYRQLVDNARRPVLVPIGQVPNETLLRTLRDLGVEAVVYVLPADADPEKLRDEIGQVRKTIDGLGAPVGRGRALEEPKVVLPQIGGPAEDDEDAE